MKRNFNAKDRRRYNCSNINNHRFQINQMGKRNDNINSLDMI